MSIEEMIKMLPEELQDQVREYVKSLLQKQANQSHHQPNFEWEGALKGLKTRYTSVELQHKVSDWRAGDS